MKFLPGATPPPAGSWRTIAFFLGPPLLLVSMLLAIALLFTYSLAFLGFVPALLFLLGLGLTLAGAQPWWVKGLGILLPVGLPALGLYVFFQVWMVPPRPEHVVVLLPATFRGEVDIVQNEWCGTPLARPDGQLTLTIPASGLVVTSSTVTEDLLKAATYCRVDERGRRLDTLRQVTEDVGGTYVQQATGSPVSKPQAISILLNGAHVEPPAGQVRLPDQDYPAPGTLPVKPVRYVSFLVAYPDSFASRHQSPAFRQKLRLRVDVPTGCDRLRATVRQ